MFQSRETKQLLQELAAHDELTKRQERIAYDRLVRIEDPVEGSVSVKDTAKIRRIIARTKSG